MVITAKYSGKCAACGASINPGDQINWERGGPSRHVKCPGTVVRTDGPCAVGNQLLNSPGRQALQGRGRKDFFLGERTEIVRAFVFSLRPDAADFGQTMRDKSGEYLTSVGLAAHWVSQDEADDFDLIGPDGGFGAHWSTQIYYRPATNEERAECETRLQAKERQERFNKLCRSGGIAIPYEDAKQVRSVDAVEIWTQVVGWSCHYAWRTPAGLLSEHPVYDSDPIYRLLAWAHMTPEDADMIRQAPAKGDDADA